jgi:hypothetical protein
MRNPFRRVSTGAQTDRVKQLLDEAHRLAEEYNHGGLSLRFVRELLGDAPRYASAHDARIAVGMLEEGPPPYRAVAYYDTPEGMLGAIAGNVAVGDGTGSVVGVNLEGHVRHRPYDDPEWGVYAGWSRDIGARHKLM